MGQGIGTQPTLSMTGYCSVELDVEPGLRVQVELRSLNHRFLDIKTRLPRDLSSIEPFLRAFLQEKLNRGAVEIRVDRVREDKRGGNQLVSNLALAADYYECLTTIQKALGLTDSIRTLDIAEYPDVISASSEAGQVDGNSEALWGKIRPAVEQAVERLIRMRATEGLSAKSVLESTLGKLKQSLEGLRARREQLQKEMKNRVSNRVRELFSHYSVPEMSSTSLLESRVAQELALVLDRSDIEEELTRLMSHLSHFQKTLDQGGPSGRKLEFLLQELHREANTLGNKAQDCSIAEETLQIKLWIEQMREQVMNIE